jgi:protein-tyrosine phosphatase
MDRDNERELLARAPGAQARAKVRLLREFDPASVAAGDVDVPDPYYGGPHGFDRVLDQVEAACRGLLDEVRSAGAA